jgi:DNA-binding HxlR family transcriptional regulator
VKRSTVAHLNCSIARTLEIVGEWWTLLVVRDVALGFHRFDDIQRDLGISRNILSDRLATLVEHDILERRPYQDSPPRFEYHLTAKGRDLWPVLAALSRWGDRWESPEGPPVRFVHKPCGHDTEGLSVCPGCGEEVALHEVRLRKGPGWKPPLATNVT